MHKHQSHCVVRSDLEISSAGDEITAHAPNGQDWHFLYVTAVWRKKRKGKKKSHVDNFHLKSSRSMCRLSQPSRPLCVVVAALKSRLTGGGEKAFHFHAKTSEKEHGTRAHVREKGRVKGGK